MQQLKLRLGPTLVGWMVESGFTQETTPNAEPELEVRDRSPRIVEGM